MIELANDFRQRVKDMSGLSTFGREYCDSIDCALDMDLTKVQIRTVESGYRGFDIDHILENEMNIITEKSDAYTIMFITTFEIHKKDMLATASSLSELISSDKYERHWDIDKLSEITVPFPHTLDKVMEFPDAIDAIEEGRIKTVEFSELEGRICAENITLYPPGIPLIIAGERFTKEVLTYLDKTRKGLTEIIAHDPKMNTADVMA
jgi:arginine/lysine/ornithine decarboxylase